MPFLDVFLRGVLAGFGIAIPVGPIAVLIIELGIRRGFRVAFCAGAGTASADLIYLTLATLAGRFIASILTPYSTILHLASASVLVLLGLGLLYRAFKHSQTPKDRSMYLSRGYVRTYAMVLGLTLLNPLTVTFFTTLILGMRTLSSDNQPTAFLFVAGAVLASLSWQTFLAGVSGFAHRRFSHRLQTATFAVGNLVIIGLGIMIFLGVM